MDKEDFAQWKDSHATQWVLGRLQAIADRVEAGMKSELFASPGLASADWMALQANAADAGGYVRAIREIVQLEIDDIADSSETAAA